jgi:hypothetical protein
MNYIEVMKMALEALEEINKLSIGESAICLPAEIDAAMDALRQAIEQAEQQEPVAWRWKERINGDFDSWVVTSSEPPPYAVEKQPLYTAPPQRSPLTYPQIHELDWPDGVAFEEILLFVRAIEAAHGIGEKA